MCRAFATVRRIKRSGWASMIVMLACSFTLSAAQRGRTLFLLTGTCFLNDTSQTFPAVLYTVSAQRKLEPFRTVVSGNEGTTNILDDMRGAIYVSFPSNLGVSRAPTKVSVIHEQRPGENDVVTFNPEVLLDEPYAEGTAAGPDLSSYGLFVLFPQPPSTVNGHDSFMRFLHSSVTTLMAVAANSPAKGSRVTRNAWALYGYLTFSGSPGGPGAYPTPEAVVEDGNLIMRYGGRTVFVDQAPAFPKGGPRTIWILAASSRFVASMPLHFGGGNYTYPATMYVHDRQNGSWKELKSAGSMPQCRIFGFWLATRVRNLKQSGRYLDTNPGHNDESHQWIKYERPDVREEFGSIDFVFDIPGIFTLDNLVDGRRITLKTNEEDSEILAVRSDGLVLYRVNDEIYSAQIEGDKLSTPTLVVKDDDVPEVHWAFWSNARVKPQPAAQPSPN